MPINPREKGLGRRVNHDPRSLRYVYEPRSVDIQTVEHKRIVEIFDQGDLGSCTGHATVGVLGSEPYAATLPHLQVTNELAVEIYSAATKLDPFDGSYPPEDTGSDGNSAAKAARNAGYISGWQHITSIDGAKTAIQTVPFITGTYWYNSMFDADENGVVRVEGGDGDIVGGHEYQVVGYNAETDQWKFANSWGPEWADNGYFYMSNDDYARLLSERGDATVFVALSEPAPEPVPEPVPEPQPEPTPTDSEFPIEVVQKWIDGKHYTRREQKAADAIQTWINENSV